MAGARISAVALAVLAGATGLVAAAEPIDGEAFQGIVDRSPDVLDVFYEYQRLDEMRSRSGGFIELRYVLNEGVRLATDHGLIDAGSLAGSGHFGGALVLDRLILRAGVDLRALSFEPDYGAGARPSDVPPDDDDDWGHFQITWFLGFLWRGRDWWNRWGLSGGALAGSTANFAEEGQQRVFAVRPDKDGKPQTNHDLPWGAFFDFRVPFLTTALVLDDAGVDRLKTRGIAYTADALGAVGPYFAAFPPVKSYQVGVYLADLSPTRFLTLTSEAGLRQEDDLGLDHVVGVAELHTAASHDTRYAVQLGLSHYDAPGVGALTGLRARAWIRWGAAGLGASVGQNYYSDLIQLPIPNVTAFGLEAFFGSDPREDAARQRWRAERKSAAEDRIERARAVTQRAAAAPPEDLTGQWRGEAVDSSGPGHLTFDLAHAPDKEVSGPVIMGGRQVGTFTGHLEGAALDGKMRIRVGRCRTELDLRATATGDTISGRYRGTTNCGPPVTGGQLVLHRR